MGHDTHFLRRLDRLSDTSQLEFALSLYNDAELLREVMKYSDVPEAADRIAISLNHREHGPFIIVARNGRFVTCLGEGMHLGDLPVITRERLDEVAEYVSTLRERIARAQEREVDGNVGRLLRRIWHSGDTMTREEMFALGAVRPMLAPTLYELCFQDSADFLISCPAWSGIPRLRKREEATLRSAWHTIWATGHIACLLGTDQPDFVADPLAGVASPGGVEAHVSVAELCVMMKMSYSALRGAWCIATTGPRALDYLSKTYDAADNGYRYHVAVSGLMALAGRHPEMTKDVARVLSRPAGSNLRQGESPWLSEYERDGRGLKALVAGNARANAARRVQMMAMRILQSNKATERCGVVDPSDLSIELATALAFHQSGSILSVDAVLTSAHFLLLGARLPFEQLYLPADLHATVRSGWSLQKGKDILRTYRLARGQSEPERAEPRPGPNQPCRCGSGTKYKRCCGVAGRS